MTTSEKYHFLASGARPDRQKTQRCTAEIAALYRRKEGHHAAPVDAEDRRAVLFELVAKHLGEDGARCEPYLCDAALRWLVSSTGTEPSAVTYLQRLAAWCEASDRRCLSGQVGTATVHVLDHLRSLEAKGLAPRTVVGHRDVVRSWFAWLEERGLMARSPINREVRRGFKVDQKAVKKADGNRQAFTLDEARKVVTWCFKTARPEQGASVMLQLVAGLRSAEVADAGMAGYLDKDGLQTLTLRGKGRKQRTITLEPVTVAAIRRYLKAERRQGARGALLRAPDGGHYVPRTIQGWAKQAARACGRPEISSHDLRHTAATLLMEAGAHLFEVRDHLGHCNAELTSRCYVVRRPKMVATTGLNPPGELPEMRKTPDAGRLATPTPTPA